MACLKNFLMAAFAQTKGKIHARSFDPEKVETFLKKGKLLMKKPAKPIQAPGKNCLVGGFRHPLFGLRLGNEDHFFFLLWLELGERWQPVQQLLKFSQEFSIISKY